MHSSVQSVLASLPGELILEDRNLLPKYTKDFRGKYAGNVAAVLRPRSTQEVSLCVQTCASNSVSLVPQGGNTSYCGGATPDASGKQLVLSLERMNRVREFDVLNRSMTVEAGIVLSKVQDLAAEKGLLFPLALGAQQSCQIGGNLSTNAGGLNVLRFGMARRMVLGLEVVLPDGQIIDTLAPLRKKNAGYDTDQLFIGAEGTLGIITAASILLERRPTQTATAFLAVAGLETLPVLLENLQSTTGDSVTSFEYISEHSLRLLLGARKELRRPLDAVHDHYALCEVSTTIPAFDLNRAFEETVTRAFEDGQVVDGTIAANEAQRAALWELRESLPEGESLNGGSVKHDVAVRVSRVPEFISAASACVMQIDPSLRLSIYGHVGDGNIHFNVLPAIHENATVKAMIDKDVSPAIYNLIAAMGGAFSAEYGLGQEKIELAKQYSTLESRDLMKRIKSSIDPEFLMNPGKVVGISQ